MSWKTACLKNININPSVTTYCGLSADHEGECKVILEEWEIQAAIKILQERGYLVKKIEPIEPTLYIAKEVRK